MQVIDHSLPPADPAGRTALSSRLHKPRTKHLFRAAGLVLCLAITACGGGGGGSGGSSTGGGGNAGSEGVARNTHCAR